MALAREHIVNSGSDNDLITSLSSIPANNEQSMMNSSTKQGVFIIKNPLETSASAKALPMKGKEPKPGFQPIPDEHRKHSPLVQKIHAVAREKLLEMSDTK
jgi:hypothetical protein